jgi:hypothetical protein
MDGSVGDRFVARFVVVWDTGSTATTPVASQEAPMANKDKGGKSSKKVAEKTLKEKRLAKKAKKALHTNQSLDDTFGH